MARRTWSDGRRAAGALMIRLVEVAVGVWIASVLVAGLALAPWPDVVLLAAALLASHTLVTAALRPLARRLDALVEWNVRRGLDGPDWLFHVMGAVWVVWALVQMAATVALAVGLLGLVVQALGAIGLPNRLEGFWPTVTAAAVLFAGAGLVGWLRSLVLALLVRRRRARLWWADAELPLTAVALAGGVLLLPGVELAGGLGLGGQLLVLAVLAMAITSVRLGFTAPFLVLVLTFAVNGVKVWLVGLIGAWLTVPLRIDGPLSHAALALLITALAWPAVRARYLREAHWQRLAAMEAHQQMVWAMHQATRSPWEI